jgi:hypothetical protein
MDSSSGQIEDEAESAHRNVVMALAVPIQHRQQDDLMQVDGSQPEQDNTQEEICSQVDSDNLEVTEEIP